jgi:hypothetical protein
MLKRIWKNRKAKVLPKNAVTFQLRVWGRRRLEPQTFQEAKNLMQKFGFNELLLVHGNALLVNGQVVIVSGPKGIGKSTVSRILTKQGKANQLEDGVLVVGRRESKLFLVKTGTGNLAITTSKLSKFFRNFLRVGKSSYLKPDGKTSKFKDFMIKRVIAMPSVGLSVFLTRKNKESFEPSLHEIQKVAFAFHPNDEEKGIKIGENGTLEVIQDIRTEIPASMGVQTFSSVGRSKEVQERIRQAILYG